MQMAADLAKVGPKELLAAHPPRLAPLSRDKSPALRGWRRLMGCGPSAPAPGPPEPSEAEKKKAEAAAINAKIKEAQAKQAEKQALMAQQPKGYYTSKINRRGQTSQSEVDMINKKVEEKRAARAAKAAKAVERRSKSKRSSLSFLIRVSDGGHHGGVLSRMSTFARKSRRSRADGEHGGDEHPGLLSRMSTFMRKSTRKSRREKSSRETRGSSRNTDVEDDDEEEGAAVGAATGAATGAAMGAVSSPAAPTSLAVPPPQMSDRQYGPTVTDRVMRVSMGMPPAKMEQKTPDKVDEE